MYKKVHLQQEDKMEVINKIKNHVSNNKKKYIAGTVVTGAGIAANEFYPNEVNQLSYNVKAHGNNLINQGKEKLNDTIGTELNPGRIITPEEMAEVNDYYNSDKAKFYSPKSDHVMNVMDTRANTEDKLNGYYDAAKNYVKDKYDEFTESTVVQIDIKSFLLEENNIAGLIGLLENRLIVVLTPN